MLLEKVGDPVTGLIGLGKAAALDALGSVRKLPHWAGPVAGVALSADEAFVKGGGLDGRGTDGAEAAGYAALKGVLDYGAAHVPGADAVVAAAEGAGQAPWMPSEAERTKKPNAAAGGDAGGATAAAAGPAGAGAGHRVTKIDGTMTEMIGG